MGIPLPLSPPSAAWWHFQRKLLPKDKTAATLVDTFFYLAAQSTGQANNIALLSAAISKLTTAA